MGIGYATAARKAQDRDQWQSMVSKVPDGYRTRDWLINKANKSAVNARAYGSTQMVEYSAMCELSYTINIQSSYDCFYIQVLSSLLRTHTVVITQAEVQTL